LRLLGGCAPFNLDRRFRNVHTRHSGLFGRAIRSLDALLSPLRHRRWRRLVSGFVSCHLVLVRASALSRFPIHSQFVLDTDHIIDPARNVESALFLGLAADSPRERDDAIARIDVDLEPAHGGIGEEPRFDLCRESRIEIHSAEFPFCYNWQCPCKRRRMPHLINRLTRQ
jgi:hypothetical protein